MQRDKIAKEIEDRSEPEDRALLLFALDACRFASEWQALATSEWTRYGVESYKVRRKWVPTKLLRQLVSFTP